MRAQGIVVALLVMSGASVAVAQESVSRGLPVAVTDKQAVEEWQRAIWDKPLDPAVPSDTAFMLTLSETELLGRLRFKQRCAICHSLVRGQQPNTWGPILTQRNVNGREERVRRQIEEGSARMPAFKYALEPKTIDVIIAYLKRVERIP